MVVFTDGQLVAANTDALRAHYQTLFNNLYLNHQPGVIGTPDAVTNRIITEYAPLQPFWNSHCDYDDSKTYRQAVETAVNLFVSQDAGGIAALKPNSKLVIHTIVGGKNANLRSTTRTNKMRLLAYLALNVAFGNHQNYPTIRHAIDDPRYNLVIKPFLYGVMLEANNDRLDFMQLVDLNCSIHNVVHQVTTYGTFSDGYFDGLHSQGITNRGEHQTLPRGISFKILRIWSLFFRDVLIAVNGEAQQNGKVFLLAAERAQLGQNINANLVVQWQAPALP